MRPAVEGHEIDLGVEDFAIRTTRAPQKIGNAVLHDGTGDFLPAV
jgi:hypothetical protein